MLFKLFWITKSNVKKIVQYFSLIFYICFGIEDVFAMYNDEEQDVSNVQSMLANPAVAHPNTNPEFFIITEVSTELSEETEEEENTGCCPVLSNDFSSENCPNPCCHPLAFYGTMRNSFPEVCDDQCSSLETILTSGCLVFQFVGDMLSSLFSECSEEASLNGEPQRGTSCPESGKSVSTPVITPPTSLYQQGNSLHCLSGSKFLSPSSTETVFLLTQAITTKTNLMY